MKITDKMRLDWLLNRDTPLYARRGRGWVLNVSATLIGLNEESYRDVIDAAIRSAKRRKA